MSWDSLSLSLSLNQINKNQDTREVMELFDAIKKDDIKTILHYFEMGKANVNANINNETPLMVAMKLEKLEIFNLLINSHANVNQEIDDSGHTLIWRALWQNKMDFFSSLAKKASKNTRESKSDRTILMESVLRSNLDAVKTLIINDFKVGDTDNIGNTALHYATKNKRTQVNDEIIIFLLDSGADAEKLNSLGEKPSDLFNEDIDTGDNGNNFNDNDDVVLTNNKKHTNKNNSGSKSKPPKYKPK